MSDAPGRFIRTHKIIRDRAIYALNITSNGDSFHSSWRCLPCNKGWKSTHGEPTDDAALNAAMQSLEKHHVFYHASPD
jgi:hypothetical protein